MGYWEPHSSSIDFCESNYIHSSFIAEWHNTWSSLLGISSLGVIGMIYGNPTNELRYTLAYVVLIGIGIGSVGLHGSLHWFFQSSDELPMIYLIMCLYYMLAEYDAPITGPPNHRKLPLILSYITALLTAIYYAFQKFYLFFILTFIGETCLVLFWFYRILFPKPIDSNDFMGIKTNKRSASTKYIGITAFVSFAFVGFPLWLYDMFRCQAFLPSVDHIEITLFRGITPHVAWHFFSGYGAYCAIICLSCCRLEELNIPFGLKRRFLVLPVPVLVPMERSKIVSVDRILEEDELFLSMMQTGGMNSIRTRSRTATC